MRSDIIEKLVGTLLKQCRKEKVQCVLIISDDDLTETYQSMDQRSPAIQRSIGFLSDPAFLGPSRIDEMSSVPALETKND